MAIENKRMQQRYGPYSAFQQEINNLLPQEFAGVTNGDPNTSDGRALYYSFGAGTVKRIPFSDELDDNPSQGGENGATFIPHVSEDGTLSWTNDGGFQTLNP